MALVDQLGRRISIAPVCDDPFVGARICRACGCTEDSACPGGCYWVLLDVQIPAGICSACAIKLGWKPEALASVIHPEVAAMFGIDLPESGGSDG